ncbi:uncharacterized protein LOC128241396 [Mya arenaria]|uniref:uncharacterized protein LOC128241396 n=1 Tax=Mya arenaria TaxID=6604 RepID=UPI0022E73ED3|nr:uncharacterized protein LOC128241396 [Mya arenaria]
MYQQNTLFSPGTFRFYKDVEQDHEDLSERLRKTLYYGKLPGTDRPSMPLTELGVNFYQHAAPRELGKLDEYLAASTTRSACVSPTSMLVGMMYVRRLHQRRPDYLSQISSSELFLISMMMASKFLYDEGSDDEVYNDEWAVSADMETEDVNELEREFLNAIEWQLFVRPEEFAEMLHTVEKRIALEQGLARGWFSYTDMMILSQDLKFMTLNDLTKELSKVFSATSLAYLASILTMIGSTLAGTATSSALSALGTTTLPIFFNMVTPNLATLTHIPAIWSSDLELGAKMILDFSSAASPSLLNNETLGERNKPIVEQLVETDGKAKENPGDDEIATDSSTQSPLNQQKESQHSLLNSLLPPFLALMTLKDSVLDYAFGAKSRKQDQYNLGHNMDTTGADIEEDEPTDLTDMSNYCSAGPCLMDSWPNCFNVSSEHDWSEFKTFNTLCGQKMNPCCRNCALNDKAKQPTGNWNWNRDMDYENGNDLNDYSVKCCCRFSHLESSSWLKGSLEPKMFDLNLRFSTQSLFQQALITT